MTSAASRTTGSNVEYVDEQKPIERPPPLVFNENGPVRCPEYILHLRPRSVARVLNEKISKVAQEKMAESQPAPTKNPGVAEKKAEEKPASQPKVQKTKKKVQAKPLEKAEEKAAPRPLAEQKQFIQALGIDQVAQRALLPATLAETIQLVGDHPLFADRVQHLNLLEQDVANSPNLIVASLMREYIDDLLGQQNLDKVTGKRLVELEGHIQTFLTNGVTLEQAIEEYETLVLMAYQQGLLRELEQQLVTEIMERGTRIDRERHEQALSHQQLLEQTREASEAKANQLSEESKKVAQVAQRLQGQDIEQQEKLNTLFDDHEKFSADAKKFFGNYKL